MTEMEYKTMQKEFSKLRSDNEALRRFLLNAQTESDTRGAALESARAELQKERLDSLSAESQAYESYAQARALAMEEAASLVAGLLAQGFHKSIIPDRIRGLAPLPASLVAVPREVLEKVREALMVLKALLGDAK